MRLITLVSFAVIAIAICASFWREAAYGQAASSAAPAATTPGEVEFDQKVWPILQARCAKCHLGGNRKGGFRLDSRDLILQGGDTGPGAVPHQSAKSLLIDRLTTSDKDDRMPKKAPPLPKVEIDVIRSWVDRGMPWGKAAPSTRPSYIPPLLPRRPTLPARSAGTNPIDLIVGKYFEVHKITPPPVIADRVYARRAYMDVLGLLPTPQQLADFEADPRADKRPRLIAALMSDHQAYAENWMSFWNDALRNDYQGTGYIDGGRTQITKWLYNALESNKPYDQFVGELIAAAPGAEGFTRGIVWRGAVSASQRPELQAAQGISQVFLGINMKCASCHDSFINDWKLADAYGLASIYSEQGSIDIFRCEKPTGKTATARFIYPQLGEMNAADPKPARMKRLADLITSPQNGRLTRTIVNRIWQRFMGRGIVEPADDMDKEPWSADLLDELASDLSDHHYDLKQTIALILTSRVYQLPSTGESDVAEGPIVFHGPTVRRMSAEQFRDAVASVTGIWPSKPATTVFPRPVGKAPLAAARWIWSDDKASVATAPGTIYLRKTLKLSTKPASAFAVATCDNRFVLYVNGKKAAEGDEWKKPQHVDLTPYLQSGENVIAVAATNDDTGKPNPAGFFLTGSVVVHGDPEQELITDGSWFCSKQAVPNWNELKFDIAGWQPASVLGDSSLDPWKIDALLPVLSEDSGDLKVRSVWTTRDAIMNAMGRPNREQVVTSRITQATMLQALEFTNGPELTDIIARGARKSLTRGNDPRQIILDIFQRALGRDPLPVEMEQCRQLLGDPARQDGVEDLYWSVFMLPEFQLIY